MSSPTDPSVPARTAPPAAAVTTTGDGSLDGAKLIHPGWAIADDLGKLLLRVGFGGFMVFGHGLKKFNGFEGTAQFMDGMLGLPGTVNAALAVGAELVCAALVVIGLGTRLACLPLIFTMGYAAIVFHGGDPVFSQQGKSSESAWVYLFAFAAILLTGPGRLSIDQLIAGKLRQR